MASSCWPNSLSFSSLSVYTLPPTTFLPSALSFSAVLPNPMSSKTVTSAQSIWSSHESTFSTKPSPTSFSVALWTKNWAKFDVIMPFLGIAASIAGAFYALGILVGDIVHVPKPCSGVKRLVCETENLIYAVGGPSVWGVLWFSVALLLLYLSCVALKENLARRKELSRTSGKRER